MADERLNITGTFGAAFIGTLGMMALYGVTSAQTFIYFAYYPEDVIGLKALVTGVWVLDTVHTVLVCHGMYYYLVLNYGNPIALATGTTSLWLSIGLNNVVACIVQSFFTIRLYHLMSARTKMWLMPILVLVVLAHFVFGIETMIQGLILKQLARLKSIALVSAMPFAITAVLSDVIIAAALCVTLWKTKAYFLTTSTLVNRLMIFAIHRCLLTAGAAVIEVMIFAVLPDDLWFLALDFVIGKLYANSLLATLNTRYSVQGGRGQGMSTDEESAPAPTHGPGRLGMASGIESRGETMFSTIIRMGPIDTNNDDTHSVEECDLGDPTLKKKAEQRGHRPCETQTYELEVLN